MVKSFFNALIMLFVLAGFTSAQNISVEASTDTNAYKIGDYIHYIIKVEARPELLVNGPIVSDTLAGMELISQSAPQKEQMDGRQLITYNYVFSKYDSSDVTIPPVSVYYRAKTDSAAKVIQTAEVYFTVRPLKVNPAGEIKDVKAPLRIPLDWRWIALWVVIALILLAAAYYIYKKYSERKAGYIPEKVVVKIPAHITALKSLRSLREKQLWQKGMVKDYHSEITAIIRRYFEERFDLPALEMTSGEAVDELRRRAGTEKIIADTENFLSNADLVKFAKFQPMASVNEEMMKQAEEIVQKTKNGTDTDVREVTENVH